MTALADAPVEELTVDQVRERFAELIQTQHLGPVWDLNPDWNGVSTLGPHGKYKLPEFSLGYQILAWIHENLLSPDSTEQHPRAFSPTFEQARFIIWWYAVDGRGRWLFRRGVFQRLKGHGKDPLAAVIGAVELNGPCRIAGWALADMPEHGLNPDGSSVVKRGMPVGEENPNAWIQIAAVSKQQTKNTMKMFPGLFNAECMSKAYMRGDSIGATKVTSFRGRRVIEALTSNPAALEGARPSLVIKNETEHWTDTNNGVEMNSVINRNAAKSKGGAARSLAICNAPDDSEESVGLSERRAYEAEVEGRAFKTGVLYDSLELKDNVPLFPPGIEGLEEEDQERLVLTWLQMAIERIRGDSWWLDPERIALEILDQSVTTTEARRFYFNQVASSDEVSFKPKYIEAAVEPLVGALRTDDCDHDRIGWEIVHPDDPIVAFFDGSKSDDSTAIVACRLSDGYCFTIGIWQPPPKKRRGRNGWLAPRGAIDTRVDEMFERFTVVAFWADPSHTKDDDTGSGYWDGLIDEWHKRFKLRLQVWATKTGNEQHSIMWDMAAPHRTKAFVEAVERTTEDFQTDDSDGFPAPTFSFDGHPLLRQHLKNSRLAPGRWGVGMRKEGRESLKKIDSAVCLVGARMLRRVVLNSEPEEETKGGWGEAF